MAELPSGTVTFLFTEVEGSTRLLNRLGHDRYEDILAEQQGFCAAFAAHDGQVADTQGDSFFAALLAPKTPTAGRRQHNGRSHSTRGLTASRSERKAPQKVRIGIHSGEASDAFVGISVHCTARISARVQALAPRALRRARRQFSR